MTDPINLNNFKNKKKYEKVVSDLNNVIKIYDLCINALKYFKKYSIVMETISVLQSNKILLEIHLKKYNDLVKPK